MNTKTKIALAAAAFALTSSVAMAQGFDANFANRYPGLANPITQDVSAQKGAQRATLQSAPVRLQRHHDFEVGAPAVNSGWATPVDVDRADRASSPYAGGGF